MIIRMSACRDLAKNGADLKKIKELFLTLQTSATPASLLLPWFPSPARKRVKQATTDLFTMLCDYIETRRHAEPTSDAIDVLIADGETTHNIAMVSPAPKGVWGFVRSDPAFLDYHGGTSRWRCWHWHRL
jgi:hypothetical protein